MSNISNIIALFLTGLVGIIHFGYAPEYDRYLLVFLLLSCLFTISKDKNIFCLFLILAVELAYEEMIWLYTESDYYLKIPLYIWGLIGCYLTKDMAIGKLGFFAILLIFASELYWIISGYNDAPDLGWSVFILGQVLIVHEAAFMRAHITPKIFPLWRTNKFTLADGYIMDIYKVRAFLELINIVEYLVRHLFGLNEMTIIYYTYPYVAHALTLATVWVIFYELINILKRQFFPA